jgi:transposase-like protein
MASSRPPRCPLCGEAMREERGMERRHHGRVERTWTCPACLHRMVTEDVEGVAPDGRDDGDAAAGR